MSRIDFRFRHYHSVSRRFWYKVLYNKYKCSLVESTSVSDTVAVSVQGFSIQCFIICINLGENKRLPFSSLSQCKKKVLVYNVLHSVKFRGE